MFVPVRRCDLVNLVCNKGVKRLVSHIKNYSDEVYQHSVNVAKISVFIGFILKNDENTLQKIYTAGLLHDYGKLFIPQSILFKNGRLTDSEFLIMRTHVDCGVLALTDRDCVSPEVLRAISEHHEKIDGSGYPKRVTEISTIGKILAIADVYDALTNTRCYKNRCSVEYTLNQIKLGEGYEFDTESSEALINNQKNMLECLNTQLSFDVDWEL